MSRNATITIRPARDDDAQEIAAVHHGAVFHAGAGSYPPDTLRHWSGPLNEERIAEIRETVRRGERHFLVAEAEGAVVGFVSVDMTQSEMGGAFVAPNFGREGIGSQLLKAIETFAVEENLSELFINASLNSERFYAEHGYEVIGPYIKKLMDGTDLPTTRMHKTLSAQQG